MVLFNLTDISASAFVNAFRKVVLPCGVTLKVHIQMVFDIDTGTVEDVLDINVTEIQIGEVVHDTSAIYKYREIRDSVNSLFKIDINEILNQVAEASKKDFVVAYNGVITKAAMRRNS